MAEAMEMEMEFSDGEAPQAVTLIPATSVHAYNTASNLAAHGSSALGKRKEETGHGQLPGYIFMCNGRTKPECYRYRVFGLPKGRRDVVEKIKLGMKLFLYDFEKRLLYGIYEATTGGKVNIEPSAFNGKFPAQVGFRIYKDCYPLPESSFKSAIQDNYKGAKFKQELSGQQVMSLLSLFRSFTAPELESVPPILGSMASPSAIKLPGFENNQFHLQTRALSFEEQYMVERQLKRASSVLDPQFVCQVEALNYSHRVPRLVTQSSSNAQHSYSGPPIESQSMCNLNQQFCSSATQQQHLQGDPPRSSIPDPYVKYLSILANVRRYGTDQETIASEYYPPTSTGNEYYPSTSSGTDYYPSTASGTGYYSSTSQRSGETAQQPGIPPGYYYHHQVSPALNATEDVQSYAEATGYTSQSHVEAISYNPQSQAEAIVYNPQSQAEAFVYNPQSHAEAIRHNLQSHAEAIGYTAQPHAEATGYNPHSHVEASGYTSQLHAQATGYVPQSHSKATGYAPQSHAQAIWYAPQSNADPIGYTPGSHAEMIGYAPHSNAEATGYTSQPLQSHTAVMEASGVADGNVSNVCYYSMTAGTTTS